MEQEFNFKINKKRLVLILGVFTLFFGVASYRFHINKGIYDMLMSVNDEILGSTFVAFLLSMIFLYLKTEEDKQQIKILETVSIDKELSISRETTQSWNFSGGAGSETRGVTLPVLSEMAKKKSIITIKIQIIDPTDISACKNYCEYRAKRHGQADWTPRKLQLKLYSTILSCMYWAKNSPLHIDIYLKNTFSTFRYDISDDRIIITKEDPNSHAFLVEKNNPFFHSIVEEFHRTSENSRKLNFDKIENSITALFVEGSAINPDLLQNIFLSLGIIEEFTFHECQEIVLHAKPNFKKSKVRV